MVQQVKFPDYKDRSLNHPSVLVNLDDFLDMYYQQNYEAQTMSTSSEDDRRMKQWFTKAALMNGWPAIGFMGKDVLLSIVPLPTWVDETIDRDLETLDMRMGEPLPDPLTEPTPASPVQQLDAASSTSATLAQEYNTAATEVANAKEVVAVNAEDASAQPAKQPDTTVAGKTGSMGSVARVHVSFEEVAAYGDTKKSNDYKRG